MPKWLSSLLVAIGFVALVVLAVLPRNLEVTVSTNVKNNATNEMTVNYNGDAYERYYHNGAVVASPSKEDEDNPEE